MIHVAFCTDRLLSGYILQFTVEFSADLMDQSEWVVC